MNDEQIKILFPRASKSFIEANPGLFASQSKPGSGAPLVDQVPGETKSDGKPSVSIVMFRVRLLDPDNAYGATKPLIDCLQSCNLIPGDSEKEISLQVSQEKVAHYREERTELKIVYP